MESSDREILLEIRTQQGVIIQELGAVKARVASLEQRIAVVDQDVRVLLVQVDSLQTSVYWVLAAIGIFLAGLALPGIIASFKLQNGDK